MVYDSVGKDTYKGSVECLAWRGMLVSFGQSSGHSLARSGPPKQSTGSKVAVRDEAQPDALHCYWRRVAGIGRRGACEHCMRGVAHPCEPHVSIVSCSSLGQEDLRLDCAHPRCMLLTFWLFPQYECLFLLYFFSCIIMLH